ncbi:hypothetical protein ROP_28300 [Rhodococcus opacus B4]|uniref:Glutamate/phenylalanine/leucine/valine/L-tryptophan dehydrogenase C-terminal domain-containing protein n=1 Tax=Rhodococcus opacus (strain B4) TaxID=632772 RepID=C1B5F1_RHOOB|nr:hypothetical protein ROP_28300 [Rhodococcus opacus B4]
MSDISGGCYRAGGLDIPELEAWVAGDEPLASYPRAEAVTNRDLLGLDVPNILANAGGVVVSYLEWVQNLQASSSTGSSACSYRTPPAAYGPSPLTSSVSAMSPERTRRGDCFPEGCPATPWTPAPG